MESNSKNISFSYRVKAKLQAISILFKLRLATFVVFSSVVGLLVVGGLAVNWISIIVITIAGFLVTGASNAFNQVFEKDIDALMDRTKNRPVVTEYFSKGEASLYAGISAVIGLLMITLYFNEMAGILAAISLITYAFIYTPLKRVSGIAVFIGAIPGALPPMIGAVAFDGTFSTWAIYLFAIQFIWQFPHFWAIAWVSFNDYKKAGIMLLPSSTGRSKQSALITLFYTLILIPMSFYPYYNGILGIWGTIVVLLSATYFSYIAFKLYKNCDEKSARKLMFASFIYLPIVLISFLIDKI